LVLCTSIPVPAPEEEPEWTGHREAPSSGKEIGHQALESAASAPVEALLHGLGTIHPSGSSAREERWPVECIPGGHLLPGIPVAAVSCDDQDSAQDQLLPSLGSVTPSNSSKERDAEHRALITIEQAIADYVQEMRVSGRAPKTLRWHQTSLGALRRYLWRQFQFTDLGSLTSACLQAWVSDLPFVLSVRTGARRTVSTVAAYARSVTGWFARSMCQKRSFRKTPYSKPSGACPNRWSKRHLSTWCAPVSLQARPEGRTQAWQRATAPSSGCCLTPDCPSPSCAVYVSVM